MAAELAHRCIEPKGRRRLDVRFEASVKLTQDVQTCPPKVRNCWHRRRRYPSVIRTVRDNEDEGGECGFAALLSQ